MWLDDMYMLPFIILQIYYLVNGKRNWNLAILIVFNIIFNWYIAALNCIFAFIWFIFELLLRVIDEKINIKEIYKISLHYFISIILGILASSILFLPTIQAFRQTPRSSLNFNLLLDFSLLGDILTFPQRYLYGEVSDIGCLATFCGSLTIILAISIFFNSTISLKKRILLAGLSAIILSSFYWELFFAIFELLKSEYSFPYRHGYIAIFLILFLSLYSFENINNDLEAKRVFSISIYYSFLSISLFYLKSISSREIVYLNALFIILLSAIFFYIKYNNIYNLTRTDLSYVGG